jgi:hypothetical protein
LEHKLCSLSALSVWEGSPLVDHGDLVHCCPCLGDLGAHASEILECSFLSALFFEAFWPMFVNLNVVDELLTTSQAFVYHRLSLSYSERKESEAHTTRPC